MKAAILLVLTGLSLAEAVTVRRSVIGKLTVGLNVKLDSNSQNWQVEFARGGRGSLQHACNPE